MTGDARSARTRRSRHVPLVIEFDVKAFQIWKRFDRSRLDVRMADRANRAGGFCKPLGVATRARCMPGKYGSRRVVLTTMTVEARELSMRLIRMSESGEIAARILRI